jgi:hypothetical protein
LKDNSKRRDKVKSASKKTLKAKSKRIRKEVIRKQPKKGNMPIDKNRR